METVRIGIIGMGNIGCFHAGYLLEGKVEGAKLTAICDVSPKKHEEYAAKGCKTFSVGQDLIKSGLVDAVMICTPHFQHAELGICALETGLHTLVEKPIAATKGDAEKLIAVARSRPKQRFAAMFQMRVEPRYEIMRKMIRAGDLGSIIRVNWIATDWFRSEAYYASSAWRATWKGEGGGVLINQSLHQLDMMQWLMGMPSRVRGFCDLGRFHQIEVEDNVTAYFEWDNKATGVFIASTGELPGVNRLEVIGTGGRLLLENDALYFNRNTVASDTWNETSKTGFAKPDIATETIPFTNAKDAHMGLTKDFVKSILTGSPLLCPGEDGLGSIELANAIVFSGVTNETLDLPIDGEAYEKFLNNLIATSTVKKKVMEVSSTDFAASFRK